MRIFKKGERRKGAKSGGRGKRLSTTVGRGKGKTVAPLESARPENESLPLRKKLGENVVVRPRTGAFTKPNPCFLSELVLNWGISLR